MKSEPDTFSIDDLERVGTTAWDGVRNYQARNYIRSQRKGERVLFYHSSSAEPGVVGIAEIASAAYPDDTAFDPDDKHYDPKSDPSDPTWYVSDVKFVSRLPRVVTLRELQGRPELEGLFLTRKGNRLSVMPASKAHFDFIVKLSGARRSRTSRSEGADRALASRSEGAARAQASVGPPGSVGGVVGELGVAIDAAVDTENRREAEARNE